MVGPARANLASVRGPSLGDRRRRRNGPRDAAAGSYRDAGRRPARRVRRSRGVEGDPRRKRLAAAVAVGGPSIDAGVTLGTTTGRRDRQQGEGDRAGQGAQHEPGRRISAASGGVPPSDWRSDPDRKDHEDRDAVDDPPARFLRCRSARPAAMLPRGRVPPVVCTRASARTVPPIGAGMHRKCDPGPASNTLRAMFVSQTQV